MLLFIRDGFLYKNFNGDGDFRAKNDIRYVKAQKSMINYLFSNGKHKQ